VRSSRTQVEARVHALPDLRFEDQRLSSYGGAIILQALFARLKLKERLRRCFAAVTGAAYTTQTVFLLLVTHLLIGCRELRDRDYYADDPVIKRIVGLHRLPDVATIARRLSAQTPEAVEGVRALSRELVLERVDEENLGRVTLDFDGSVVSTRRHAEGTAVGYNRQRKGARSYYPLFCTVAQTSQILDVLHRPGNVHDSNGAKEFMKTQIAHVRGTVPRAILESRLDSAFFGKPLLDELTEERVQFTVSVPFDRFPELKQMIERRRLWTAIDSTWSYTELVWKPKSWCGTFRMLAIRRRTPRRSKQPLQLDLFIPRDTEFEYKVIATNMLGASAAKVLHFHNGRGSQESLFGEAKSGAQLDYVPTRRLVGNQLFLLASVFAHNLGREMQMVATPRAARNTATRAALWAFHKLDTLRRSIFQRAGRVTKPGGRLTLTLSGNQRVRDELTRLFDAQAA